MIFTEFGCVCIIIIIIIIIIIAILPMPFVDITSFQSISFVVRYWT